VLLEYMCFSVIDSHVRHAENCFSFYFFIVNSCLSGDKSGDYQNCSVLYCIRQLCTIISILR